MGSGTAVKIAEIFWTYPDHKIQFNINIFSLMPPPPNLKQCYEK